LQQRWGISFVVDGDLRFLSHHETMRMIERIAVRSGLALKYSQGFNPRPVLSFALARPVGVATKGDLFVLRLVEPDSPEAPALGADRAEAAQRLLERLNAQAPGGLRFLRAEPLTAKGTPQAIRCHYELPLSPQQQQTVRSRLACLEDQAEWPIRRMTPAKASRRRQPPRERTIDIKPLIENPRIERNALRWTAKPREALWARPTEVLAVFGLDENTLAADIIRTGVEYSALDAVPAGSSPQGAAPGTHTHTRTRE